MRKTRETDRKKGKKSHMKTALIVVNKRNHSPETEQMQVELRWQHRSKTHFSNEQIWRCNTSLNCSWENPAPIKQVKEALLRNAELDVSRPEHSCVFQIHAAVQHYLIKRASSIYLTKFTVNRQLNKDFLYLTPLWGLWCHPVVRTLNYINTYMSDREIKQSQK